MKLSTGSFSSWIRTLNFALSKITFRLAMKWFSNCFVAFHFLFAETKRCNVICLVAHRHRHIVYMSAFTCLVSSFLSSSVAILNRSKRRIHRVHSEDLKLNLDGGVTWYVVKLLAVFNTSWFGSAIFNYTEIGFSYSIAHVRIYFVFFCLLFLFVLICFSANNFI
jgi:hypothetical protein